MVETGDAAIEMQYAGKLLYNIEAEKRGYYLGLVLVRE